MNVRDKVIAVTGGAGGIGVAIAKTLCENGARVWVLDLRLDAAEAVAKDLRTKGWKAYAAALDVADEAGWKQTVDTIVEACGRLDCVVNLASKEYSQAVEPWLPEGVRLITCVFGEEKNGKVIEKGTQCKMARGEMVRWMAENRVTDPEDLKAFDRLKYRFAPEYSGGDTLVFLTEKEQPDA